MHLFDKERASCYGRSSLSFILILTGFDIDFLGGGENGNADIDLLHQRCTFVMEVSKKSIYYIRRDFRREFDEGIVVFSGEKSGWSRLLKPPALLDLF